MSEIIKGLIQLILVFGLVLNEGEDVMSSVNTSEESQEWREASPEEVLTPEELAQYYGEGATEYEIRINELTDGHVYTDSWGELVPDPMYMPQPEFGSFEGNSLFAPGWVTEDGNYILGCSAVVKVNDELPYVGLTAFHCLNVYRTIEGMELPEYVQGGVIFDAYSPNETAIAEIVKVWAMPNAESLTYGKDLAAYEVDDVSNITVLPLAEGTCEQGEVIWLYANLVSEDEDVIESGFYPCVVTLDDGTELNYILSEEVNTSGVSGSPLINSDGEVVGIHIGTTGSIRIGHSAESIQERLIEAYEYN